MLKGVSVAGGGGGGGGGDVTAAASITNNAVVVGDGGAKGVKGTGVLVDASNNVSAVNTLSVVAATNHFVVGTTTANTGTYTATLTGPRTWTMPNASGTVLLAATSSTVSSKTFDSSNRYALIIGGSTTTSTLTLQTTSVAGTTNADMIFQVGNNGATQAMRILNDGFVLIGPGTTAASYLTVYRDTASTSPFITIEQDGAGDATTQYLLTATRAWVTGVDNSDADKFKIASANTSFASGVVMELTVDGGVGLNGTITPGGTTTTQIINKPVGRVNAPAGATSVTVTNSLVTASSVIIAVAATADSTAYVTSVVAGSGSFVINTATTTAETAFNFFVFNPF
jgi:hypothetical protein